MKMSATRNIEPTKKAIKKQSKRSGLKKFFHQFFIYQLFLLEEIIFKNIICFHFRIKTDILLGYDSYRNNPV